MRLSTEIGRAGEMAYGLREHAVIPEDLNWNPISHMGFHSYV